MTEMFDWNLIKGLTMPISLEALNCEPIRVRGQLYQLGPREFVHAGYGQTRVMAIPGLVGNIFYWAPTTGAALRAVQRNISSDDGSLLRPPDELLLEGWRWSFVDIVDRATRNEMERMRIFQVPIRQRIIGRDVAVGKFSFYFRSDSDNTDKAFAVAVDIRGIRWRPCG